MATLADLFGNPATKRGQLAELLYQRSMAQQEPQPDIRTNSPQVLGSLLAGIDSAKRKVGRNMRDLIDNPQQYLGLIAERLPETAQRMASDPGNFIPGGGLVGSVRGAKVADALQSLETPAYQGLHRPPMKGSGAPLHDLTGGGQYYPDDVYSPNGLRYYGTGDDLIDREAWSLAMRVKDQPNAKVKMFRAVPYDKPPIEQIADIEAQKKLFMARGKWPKDSGFDNGSKWYEWASREIERLKAIPEAPAAPLKINHGDWVTTSKEYARQHGEGALGGNYKIISQTVPARKLFTNGDSWSEFGYDQTGMARLSALLGTGLVGLGGAAYLASQDGK